MYIKSIVIDGFKSYAVRTEINGFDNQFNAITGLNGSGKSNILDAICFLLGITNLSQVRAANLQDLVYKSGQAGVTKATVSIVFDNRDKRHQPLGYEDYEEITVTRQIVIGGRNKYLINGSCAPNNRVHDLFRSVQLNINNPHFLIMQGRITKVLNMKPIEILSLLEEAAGTKLYESKKEQAQKIIEKKELKLREIENLLTTEIHPTLTKLRKERHLFQEYQQVCREVEYLSRFAVAYRFHCYEQTKEKADVEVVEMREKIGVLKEEQESNKRQLAEISEEVGRLCRERDQQSGLAECENLHKEAMQVDAIAQSALVASKDSVKSEEKRLRELEKTLANRRKAAASKAKEFEAIRGGFEELERRLAEADAELEAARKHLQAVNSGLASSETGEAATLQEQLRVTKMEASESDSRIKQSELKLKHLQSEIKKKQAQFSRMQNSSTAEQKQLENYKRSVAQLEQQLASIGYDEAAEQQLSEQLQAAERELENSRRCQEEFEAANLRLSFHYSDPEPNFDRRRVLGLVCNLLEVADPKFATALEVTAGGKLYNVVVDSEQTAKKLVERGRLKHKTTFIPLNKISASCIPQQQVELARRLAGPQRAHPAVELVRHDQRVAAAMQFVFGGSFVVADSDAAKRITFNREIHKRAVTVEGDDFNPSGTLSGGFRGHSEPVLLRAGKLRQMQARTAQAAEVLARARDLANKSEEKSAHFHRIRQDLEQKRHELRLLEQRISDTEYHQMAREIEELQAEADECRRQAAEAAQARQRLQQREAALQEAIDNAAAVRERELQQAQQRMQKAQAGMEQRRANVENRQAEHDTLKLEIEELGKDACNAEEQIEAAKAALQDRLADVEEKKAAADGTRSALEDAKRQLEEMREEIKRRNRAIRDLEEQAKRLQADTSNRELKVADLQHRLSDMTKEAADAQHRVEELLNANPWIEEQRKNFGQPGGHFDFAANNPKEQRAKLTKLEEKKEKLGKSVNMRAMNMLASAEEQCNELVKRRDIVLGDKVKMQMIIDELDKKKNNALMNAYRKVNADFGKLFSTMLPGANAKLVPSEGKTVLEGLEFRIGFGQQWKESLSELSGGQRSLVALSLILALLLFKPAPIYILDEVDAALDLSHTQNIGQLIKEHFTHSQFVVVSLKDGMFNNANVLFKTKFVDGVSTVTRHAREK